jgi:hypothetical protein
MNFKWESKERRQAADDMSHFLKVIKWAQDFKEKIHYTFKSGRRALLYCCKENCENCGEPAMCHYWGSQDMNLWQRKADMAFDQCKNCGIRNVTRFGGEKYFIIHREKIIPTLHKSTQEELLNHWQSIVFPMHTDFITSITTTLRILCHRPHWFPLDLSPPTWNLSKNDDIVSFGCTKP